MSNENKPKRKYNKIAPFKNKSTSIRYNQEIGEKVRKEFGSFQVAFDKLVVEPFINTK